MATGDGAVLPEGIGKADAKGVRQHPPHFLRDKAWRLRGSDPNHDTPVTTCRVGNSFRFSGKDGGTTALFATVRQCRGTPSNLLATTTCGVIAGPVAFTMLLSPPVVVTAVPGMMMREG